MVEDTYVLEGEGDNFFQKKKKRRDDSRALLNLYSPAVLGIWKIYPFFPPLLPYLY